MNWWAVLIVVGLALALPTCIVLHEVWMDVIDRRRSRKAPPSNESNARARLIVGEGEYVPPDGYEFAGEIPTAWLAPDHWAEDVARAAEDIDRADRGTP